MHLASFRLTASFLQMSNFCTETQFHLINCLLLEKTDLQKTLKKSPVGQMAHWGFFGPLIPNLFCVRHFAPVKNSRRITERQPYFVLTWRAVKKNIVPIKKKQCFLRCFGSSGCNWTSLLFVSFKCFVTLAFHAFGDL